MRNAFADELVKVASENPDVVLLSGDIGNRLFNPYKEQFANRFRNCGVAEANMMGVASGLARSGWRPIAYTITPFLTARTYEQIKLDVCYHDAPVIIIGVGAGLSYASLGPTHHTFEDIGTLRMLPHMNVVCPADAWEVRAALRAALGQEHPVYIRMGKKNEPQVHEDVPEFEIGRSINLRQGSDVCLLANGTITPDVLATADQLSEAGLSARVESFHTVKPLDETLLKQVFAEYPLVVTAEEHGLAGGFGSAVAEWYVDHQPLRGRLLRFGIPDEFLHEAGSVAHARKRLGLGVDYMTQQIQQKLETLED